MLQSMSRQGNCLHNAPLESFFKTLKVEWVDRMRYATRGQARLDLIDWIEGFDNRQRLHSSIDYQSPAAFESQQSSASLWEIEVLQTLPAAPCWSTCGNPIGRALALRSHSAVQPPKAVASAPHAAQSIARWTQAAIHILDRAHTLLIWEGAV
jgi:hypothetical protein